MNFVHDLLTNRNIKYDDKLLVFLSFIFTSTLQREENKEEKGEKNKRFGVSEEFAKDKSSKKSQQNLTPTNCSEI